MHYYPLKTLYHHLGNMIRGRISKIWWEVDVASSGTFLSVNKTYHSQQVDGGFRDWITCSVWHITGIHRLQEHLKDLFFNGLIKAEKLGAKFVQYRAAWMFWVLGKLIHSLIGILPLFGLFGLFACLSERYLLKIQEWSNLKILVQEN